MTSRISCDYRLQCVHMHEAFCLHKNLHAHTVGLIYHLSKYDSWLCLESRTFDNCNAYCSLLVQSYCFQHSFATDATLMEKHFLVAPMLRFL